MGFAQKNISALLTKPYYSEQVINRINEKKSSIIDKKLIKKVESYVKSDSREELTDIDFNLHTNFILFGFYDMALVENIVSKMSKLATLTIFENDIDLILYSFGTRDVSHVLSDPRVILITGGKDVVRNYVNTRIITRDFSYNLPRIKFISTRYMSLLNKDYVVEICRYLLNQTKYYASTLGNDINDMLEGFDHTIENWSNLIKGIGINNLKDRYKGIPAIIVSAGPSLDKNIEHLKEAFGKALILTVDATMKKVLDLGIIPDSISTIERPKSMYDIFYKEVNKPQEAVFIGPSVVTREIIDDFERVVFMGRKGEPPVNAVADALGYDSLDIGMSCAHVPFAFANFVGADPIIFMGQDLAFSKEGHTHFSEASEIAKEGAKKQELVEVEGNDGSKLSTNKIFFQFLLWFENQIAQIKDKTFINATEGGAKIEGTILMTLKDAIELYCNKEIKHLSEVYDEVKPQEGSGRESKTVKVKGFLNSLIIDSNRISDEVLKYKVKLSELEYPDEQNVQAFYEMRQELDLLLNENYVLNFLLQTVTLKYNRSFNSYPPLMKLEEWNKLKSEGIRYYSFLSQVCMALKEKFKGYLEHIEKETLSLDS